MLRIDRSVTPTMAKTPTLGRLGARPAAHASRTSYGSVTSDTSSPAGWSSTRATVAIADGCRGRALRRLGPAATRRWCRSGAGGDHVAAGPSRLPVLRCGDRRIRRGDPRRTTTRRTGCARRRRTRQHARRLGADERAGQPGVDGVRAPSPTSRPGPTASPLNPARVPPDLVDSAELVAAMQRFRTYVGPGLARMEELARMS